LTDESNARAAGVRTPVAPVETFAVLVCSVSLSLAAIVWSWRNCALLNWGDAVAHLHIARRVFDCHQPRLSQLGSVWLPLPHILMLPFVQVYSWWPMVLPALSLRRSPTSHPASPVSPRAPLALTRRLRARPRLLRLNPNLLYLQTTAMTEPLFVCEMIWIVDWLVEWRLSLDNDPARSGRLLACVALALIAAIFTRYDGWIMALLAWTAIGVVLLRRGELRSRVFWMLTACVVAAPITWSFTTPWPLATGLNSRAALTPRKPSSCAPCRMAPGPRILAGTTPGSRCSSS